MTITVTYEARCDFCYANYSMGRINVTKDSLFKANFVEQLRHEGWSVARYVTCPDCKKNKRNYGRGFEIKKRRHFDTPSSIAVP